MKLNLKIIALLLVGLVGFVCIKNYVFTAKSTKLAKASSHKCACGPTEHWFHKSCVKNYNKQFVDAGLPENNDTEGLSVNVLRAIEMLAQDIAFVAQDGTAIVPTLNAQGNLLLPMFKNADYVACKEILRKVDVTTTLSAEELYQQWSAALQNMKSAR